MRIGTCIKIRNNGRNNKGTTEEQQRNTDNNVNNVNNINNISSSSSSSSSNTKDVAKIENLMVTCLRTTNTNNIMECIDYLNRLPIELIEYALKKTSRTDRPCWKYAMTILDDYVRKRFTTLEQIKADELSYKSRKQPKEETEKEKNARKLRELEESLDGTS